VYDPVQRRFPTYTRFLFVKVYVTSKIRNYALTALRTCRFTYMSVHRQRTCLKCYLYQFDTSNITTNIINNYSINNEYYKCNIIKIINILIINYPLFPKSEFTYVHIYYVTHRLPLYTHNMIWFLTQFLYRKWKRNDIYMCLFAVICFILFFWEL